VVRGKPRSDRVPAQDGLVGGLTAAVRAAHAGDALLAPSITRRLVERFAAAPQPPSNQRLQTLADRERDVLRLVAEGLSNNEIAGRLFVSPGTLKTHVARILTKLDLRDRVQVVVLAYETGLVRPGDAVGRGPGSAGSAGEV
jgi:DNA-binding NarL/FixJ family response regulator